MPGLEDQLREGLRREAEPADPSGVFDHVARRKARRRIARRVEVAGLAVVVVAGSVGGAWALSKAFRAGPARPTPVARPVHNGRILFVTLPRVGPIAASQTIYSMNPNGTSVMSLTKVPWDSSGFSWSPDFKNFSFVRFLSDVRGELDVMNTDGTGRRKLYSYDDPASTDSTAWSPAGGTIAFSTGLPIRAIQATGGEPSQLTTPAGDCGDAYPSWSPNGRKVAFVRDCSVRGFADVYVMKADGSGQTPLTNGKMSVTGPVSWSPDGTRLVFAASLDGHEGAQIYVINADGSGLLRLTSLGGNQAPFWSPDGKLIAFGSDRHGTEEIYIMNAAGTGQRSIFNAALDAFPVAWLPATAFSSGGTPPSTLGQSPTPPHPTAVPSASSLKPGCHESRVVADFDGDGTPDTATVALTRCLIAPQYLQGNTQYNTPYAIDVAWPYPNSKSHPAEGAWPLPECARECRALGATDIDHNGTAELALVVDRAGATEFLWWLELAASERGPVPLIVAPPGASGFPGGKPVRLPLAGAIPWYYFLSCTDSGRLVTTAAQLKQANEWSLHETTFRVNGTSLKVVSYRDYTEPYHAGRYPSVPGPACFPDEFPGP